MKRRTKRYEMTVAERLAGTEKALRSRKTPKQLRNGLRAYRDRLREELRAESVKR